MNTHETHIGVRVSREIADRIQRVAERTHRNKSQVVRMCVEQYIASAETELGINHADKIVLSEIKEASLVKRANRVKDGGGGAFCA